MTDTPATTAATHTSDQPCRPDTRVPDGHEPAATCPYCDRPFPERQLRDLHVGISHEGITDEEQDAYDAAVDDETDDLFVYHLMVIGALVALYAGLIILYMIILAQ
jgi:hypothetical protein